MSYRVPKLDDTNKVPAKYVPDPAEIGAATAAQGAKADTATQPADLAAGLATKVNTSTYTAGLAAKQDAASLGADVAAHVADGSALDAALRAAFERRAPIRNTSLLGGASVVASRSGNLGSANGSNGASNGTDTSAVSRIKHKAFVDLADVRFVDANLINGAPGPNDVTIQRAVELPDGSIIPITWNGQLSRTLSPGGMVLSDPLPVPPGVPQGSVVWSRSYIGVTAGGKFPLNVVTSNSGEGHVVNGAAALVYSGTIANSFTFSYGPLGMIGGTLAPVPSVAVIGDSIAAGQGDTNTNAGADPGFIQRAMYAANIGYLTIAKPGERGDQFVAPTVFSRRFAPIAGCTHAIVQYGINDVNNGATLAAMQTTALSVWTAVSGRDVTCFQTTITPSSTSSNTVPAANDAARTGFNDWLRAGAPINATTKAAVAIGTAGALLAGQTGHPLAGYFEIADLAETARNSGLWKAGYSTDGTHPNSATGHPALAAGIDTSRFVL